MYLAKFKKKPQAKKNFSTFNTLFLSVNEGLNIRTIDEIDIYGNENCTSC
jgi:hypothetical protein